MPKVTIDYDKCDGCETCIGVCPVEVFEKQGDKVVVAKESDCIVCRACETACPKEAITVED